MSWFSNLKQKVVDWWTDTFYKGGTGKDYVSEAVNKINNMVDKGKIEPSPFYSGTSAQEVSAQGVSEDTKQGDSEYDGLKISDSFGDTIREWQKEAAERQMAYQTQSAERAMEFSAQEAEKNRQWQERMSSTAFQRASDDLQKAGINPILAFSGGFGGASTPSGSSAQGVAQSGSQSQVSELNSGLEALSVYLDALSSAGDVIASLFRSNKITKTFNYFKK